MKKNISWGGQKRLSNFESLRLLCMILVLNLHSFSGWQQGSGVWQALDFYRESASICAVDCFILISGYFGIKWKLKSFFNLIFQIFFYSVGIYLVAVAFGIVDWNVKSFLLRFACLSKSSWGFVASYVILYFCSPILNAFAEKQSSKELLIHIVIFVLALNIVSFTASSAFTYAVVYLIGRLLKKIKIEEINVPAAAIYWITTTLIFVIVYFGIFKTLHLNSAEVVGKRPVGSLGYDYAAPLVIVQAVALFALFSKMKFKSCVINWCASSAFAIFLIHMHPTIKTIGYLSYTQGLYDKPVLEHIVLLTLLILAVFMGSILIDKIRIIVSNVCYSVIESLTKRISPKYIRVETYIPRSLKRLFLNNENNER